MIRTTFDAFFGRTTDVLAEATVPNGRWGDHHISIERVTDESSVRYLYRNGWDDALQCSLEDARRYFNERVAA
jgi:hypothetical protein